MDRQKATKQAGVAKQQQGGQLIKAAFPLAAQPVDYQISVHINNLLLTYSVGKQAGLHRRRMVASFKALLEKPEELDSGLHGVRITQIVRAYGVEKMREWFGLIYGWEFKNEKVG